MYLLISLSGRTGQQQLDTFQNVIHSEDRQDTVNVGCDVRIVGTGRRGVLSPKERFISIVGTYRKTHLHI